MFRSDIWRLSEALMAALWMAICNVSAGVNKTAEGSQIKTRLSLLQRHRRCGWLTHDDR